MIQLQFGKLTVLRGPAAERLKHIWTLPERDAYVGSLNPRDPELAAGRYDWHSLPEHAVLYLTGEDIKAYREYSRQHEVSYNQPREAFFEALQQRALTFLKLKKSEGRRVVEVPDTRGWMVR